jgi:hypothetical protein
VSECRFPGICSAYIYALYVDCKYAVHMQCIWTVNTLYITLFMLRPGCHSWTLTGRCTVVPAVTRLLTARAQYLHSTPLAKPFAQYFHSTELAKPSYSNCTVQHLHSSCTAQHWHSPCTAQHSTALAQPLHSTVQHSPRTAQSSTRTCLAQRSTAVSHALHSSAQP